MSFENRILKEEEKRNYIVTEDNKQEQVRFRVGTIDAENDIRLFWIGRVGDWMEPSTTSRFLYDYKGKVFELVMKYEIIGPRDISWKCIEGVERLNQEQREGLRQAFYTYKKHGFNMMEYEEKITVKVEF